jgi:non-specific serine/threonine protein kinase
LDLVESGDIYHPLAWTSSEAYEFLKNAPAFEESGILVRLPDWWRKRVRPRVRVSIGEKTRGVLGSEGLLDFHVNIALGDQKLTKAEWESLRQMDEGLAFIRGQWVEVNREKLEEVLSHWKEMEGEFARNGISFVEGMRLLAGAPTDLRKQEKLSVDREWSSVQPGSWLEETLELLRDPSRSEVILPGKSLNGTLRTYQESGLRWLWLLSKLGLGACLADDMGLGKTIQVIALLLALKRGDKKQGKPSLLILPASLLANWKTEIEKFAPSLKTLFIHSSEMNKPDMEQLARAPEKGMKGVDVVLTTYGMAMRLTWLRNVDWRLVILDEAQAVKNPDARQTKAVKQMKSDARIALTGTPVENRLTDLWSLFDFLCPGLLGSASEFRTYLKEYQLGQQITYTPIRRLVSPYILRRLKTDRSIISDLPDKTEMKAYCCLSKRQAVLYSSLVEELEEALQSSEEGIQRKGMILAYLMRFKQICNHPGQFLKNGEFDPGDSGKFERLRELCEEIGSRQEKVLVFTQFQEMTQPLSEYLAMQFGREGLVLHGGTPVKKRRGLVDAFQREDGPPFFILSLKAGGTGLNLTAASHVIHFDRWWNPAVENQATDRAFRIGQKRNVLVHKFICRGTIEEQIDMIIEDKLQLAEDLLGGGGEALLTELSNAELLKIVSLDLAKATE